MSKIKKLPKNNFDKALEGVISLLPAVTAAIAIKLLFRNNRV